MNEDFYLDMAYEDRFETGQDGMELDEGQNDFDHFCEDDYEESVCTICGAEMVNPWLEPFHPSLVPAF